MEVAAAVAGDSCLVDDCLSSAFPSASASAFKSLGMLLRALS